MQYDRETQKKMDKRTLRFIIRDYQFCKERNMTLILPHLEKALVRWFNKVNDIPLNEDDTEPPDIVKIIAETLPK